jgi:hypothetical protein
MIPTFDKEVLDTIEKIIGIPFILDSYTQGAVCFANDDEVRAAFRESFNTSHVLDYVNAIIHELKKTNFLMIPYPTDSISFWKQVAIGVKLRKDDFADTTKTTDHFEIKWYFKKK